MNSLVNNGQVAESKRSNLSYLGYFDQLQFALEKSAESRSLSLAHDTYFKALKHCFNEEKYMFRSPKLGLRHLDKSVYVDQLHRWFFNFPKTADNYMILRSGSSSRHKWVGQAMDEVGRLNSILSFMDVSPLVKKSEAAVTNMSMHGNLSQNDRLYNMILFNKKLVSPNELAIREPNTSHTGAASTEGTTYMIPDDLETKLIDFFQVYNNRLNDML